jgi:AmpE protein
MTLISILIGLGIEFYYGELDHLRNYSWFDRYIAWLEFKCSNYKFWNGPLGVLLSITLPVLALLLVGYVLGLFSVILIYIFAIIVFIYCLGPSINSLLDNYSAALKENDEEWVSRIEALLGVEDHHDMKTVAKRVFVRAHDHIFAIIFWFIVLGIFGALFYSLVYKLKIKFADIHSGYSSAVNSLYKILMWPSARLLAIGFALGGSLVHGIEGWTETEGFTLDTSEDIISGSGLGAIQFQSADDLESSLANLQEVKDLLNRTLIIWLTILGLLTLGGWLT